MTKSSTVHFSTPDDFHRWLAVNHSALEELWVGFFKRASGKPSITYSEALDEALCFGWIDGVRKGIDGETYTIRFTPRKPRSQWSAVNIKRVKALVASGRMRPPGLQAFAGAADQSRKYSYEQRYKSQFSAEEEKSFRATHKAWQYFQAQAPWYRRTATFWVVSAKKTKTRERRLATLMEDCAAGRPIKPLARPGSKKQK